jgi:hypothetical protein
MCSLLSEESTEEELTCALLRFVQDEGHTQQLREGLSAYSHRCRNLLSGMKMSLHFVRRGSSQPLPRRWVEVEQTYGSIEQLFDRLQAIYRPMKLTSIRAPFSSLVEDRQRSWRETLGVGGGNLEILPPKQENVGEFDPMHLSMGFDAFMSWRGSVLSPDRTGLLSWRTIDDQFEVTWREVENSTSRSDAFEEPSHSRETSGSSLIHSLAIPLLARVMTAHGGVMNWSRESFFIVELRWPLTQPTNIESASHEVCSSSGSCLQAGS